MSKGRVVTCFHSDAVKSPDFVETWEAITVKEQSIYKELSHYYDLIYSRKDYEKEAETIRRLILKHQKSRGNNLLEIACGTGRHVQYLQNDFNILATDASAEMLRVGRRNTRDVSFEQADMLNLNLGREFDVIICMFSSIGYVRTYANLEKAIGNFSRHLKTGGVAVVEPWFTKSTYKNGSPHLSTYCDDNLKIARECVSKTHGNVSVLDMHYLIAERNKNVKYFVDRHELGMFETEKILQFMRATGLNAKFLRTGLFKDRGIYVGVKD